MCSPGLALQRPQPGVEPFLPGKLVMGTFLYHLSILQYDDLLCAAHSL